MFLSSFLIYNSIGSIDEKALDSLSLMINLNKQLQKNNEDIFEELMKTFPSFLWVLRDFSLRLEDKFGNEITSKKYLENALSQRRGNSETIESKNRVRRIINGFFQEKDCFVMVRPTEDEKLLQNLNLLPFE